MQRFHNKYSGLIQFSYDFVTKILWIWNKEWIFKYILLKILFSYQSLLLPQIKNCWLDCSQHQQSFRNYLLIFQINKSLWFYIKWYLICSFSFVLEWFIFFSRSKQKLILEMLITTCFRFCSSSWCWVLSYEKENDWKDNQQLAMN